MSDEEKNKAEIVESKAARSAPKSMEKKLEEDEQTSFRSKDKDTCIALDALGHTPVSITYTHDPKYQMWYEFDYAALPDMKRYSLGAEVMVNVRSYEDASKRFRTNLHLGQEMSNVK